MQREVQTRIAEKFQVTVPVEIRDIFDLRVGDIFDWKFDDETGAIHLLPKRAQLITPQIRQKVTNLRKQMAGQHAHVETEVETELNQL